MTGLSDMPSQDPALDSFADDVREAGHADTIPHEERGCGELDDGAAYIRLDPEIFASSRGTIPMFVKCDPPIPYKEGHFRGYKRFSGATFEAVADSMVDFVPLSDAEDSDLKTYRDRLRQNMADLYGTAVGSIPTSEIDRLWMRLRNSEPEADHMGPMKAFQAQDILMFAGASYYEPDEFIREARAMGVNKRVPLSSKQNPPPIHPGRTRLWILHVDAIPKAEVVSGAGEGETIPGLLGYTYVNRTVYTRDADGNIPRYVQEYANNNHLDIVDIGEFVPRDNENHRLHEWEDGSDGDDDDDDGGGDDTPSDGGGDSETAEDSESGSQSDVGDDEGDGPDDGETEQDADDGGQMDVPVSVLLPREESRKMILESGDISFHAIRTMASERTDADLGQNPTKEDIADALLDAGYRINTNPEGEVDLAIERPDSGRMADESEYPDTVSEGE